MYEILLHDQVVKFYNKLDDKNTVIIEDIGVRGNVY